MKNELTFSIILTILLVGGAFLFMQQPTVIVPTASPLPDTTTTTNTKTPGIQTAISSNTTTISLSEIKKHNNISDCWIILNNKAYDVTSYIDQHPGGLAIVPFCGKDGTQAYNAIRGGAGHSERAIRLLSSFYVGDIQ